MNTTAQTTAIINQLLTDKTHDRLARNYDLDRLHLDRMTEFNAVVDQHGRPMHLCGYEHITPDVVRIMSRYYVFKNFRTDGSNLLEKTDNFQELATMMPQLQEKYKLIIWSRDKSAGFFKRLHSGRPDIFANWCLHKNRIELMYKDNFQNIFYTGDESLIPTIQHGNWTRTYNTTATK